MHSGVFLTNFEMFWKCMWSNTVLTVWYTCIFSMKSKAKEKTNREIRSDIQMSLQSWFPLHIPWIIFIMSLKMLALHQSHAQVLCAAWNFSHLLTSAWSSFLAQGLGWVQEITEVSSYSVSTQLVVNQGGAGGGGGLGRGGGRYLCKLKILKCQWNQALW